MDTFFHNVLIVPNIVNIGPCLSKLQLPKFGAIFTQTVYTTHCFIAARCSGYCH